MVKINFKKTVIILITLLGPTVYSQQSLTAKQIDSIINRRLEQQDKSTAEKINKLGKIQFKGMIQTTYLNSLTEGVGVTGIHQTDPTKVVDNTFDIKRFRLGGSFVLDPKVEVALLANFADFKSVPTNKFLENAYIKYKHNKFVTITVGQFRPRFGLENSIAAESLKTFDFSNQYYESGLNAWQSFQVGASLTGSTLIGKKELSYSASVVNGNGRTTLDNNNGKLYSSRLVFELSKANNFRIGTSAGLGYQSDPNLGNNSKEKTWVIGADIEGDVKLAEKFVLEMQLEGRQGTNHNLYFKLPLNQRTQPFEEYQMRGAYFLPNFRYFVNKQYLNSIELSCRYEYWDSNFKIDSNVQQTYTPMLGLEIFKNYAGRISTGLQIDKYAVDTPGTASYDKKLFLLLFQACF